MKNIMNKIIALSIIAAMAPMCAVSAEEADTTSIVGSIVSYTSSPEYMGCYKAVSGTVSAVTDEGTYTIADETEEEFEIIISAATAVVDEDGEFVEIQTGDMITAYIRWDTPAALSLPPQYSPHVVVVGSGESEELVDVDKYYATEENGGYVNSVNRLQFTTDENTEIVDVNGNATEITDGDDLAVFYKYTTRSIPAQTTADKVIVLGQLGEDIYAQETDTEIEYESGYDLSGVTTIKAGDAEIAYTSVQINGVYMIPLRAVAEALGHSIGWDGEVQGITVDTGYSLTVGIDKYIKGKAMATELGQAPVVLNLGDGDYTYVPVEYFTSVLEHGVNVSGDTLIVE